VGVAGGVARSVTGGVTGGPTDVVAVSWGVTDKITEK
jgi:hypothetical protein